MYRTISLAATLTLAVLPGCATFPHPARTHSTAADSTAAPDRHASNLPGSVRAAHVAEVPVEANAPDVAGHPITSVVVTQCNLIVAVYMTMPDGRLLRFDHTAHIPPDQLMDMAYSATRSERVEVSCNDAGPEGYEKHDPV